MNTLYKEFKDVITNTKLDDDEQRLISGLKKYEKISSNDEIAPFKLEVLFGTKRSALKRNNCVIVVWETGRMHRSMESLVRWCGYTDCHAPIRDSASFQYHVVCPKCKRESFISPDTKEAFVSMARQQNMDTKQVESMPLSFPEYCMNNATLKQIANRLAEFWNKLESKADIIVKSSPKDIRALDVVEHKKGDVYDEARRARYKKRATLRYSMKSLIKDLSCGADLNQRLFAMLNA